MAGLDIPDEVRSKACGAAGYDSSDELWGEVVELVRAAAPLILAAELDRLAEALDAKAKEAGIGGSIYAHGRDDGLESAANLLRRRAAELRGEG